jgi:hypothetical protein
MIDDPIVEEVRKAREELFEKCGNDLERFMEFIRKSQVQHGSRLITSLKKQHAGPQATPK